MYFTGFVFIVSTFVVSHLQHDYNCNNLNKKCLDIGKNGSISDIKIQRGLIMASTPFEALTSLGLKGTYSLRKDKEYEENHLYQLYNPDEFIYNRYFRILKEYLEDITSNLSGPEIKRLYLDLIDLLKNMAR